MTQNADQCHLLKSINLQCCQSFEKFCVLTELFLFWAPTPALQLWLGDSSGSCRLGTQNAQHTIREHWWKTVGSRSCKNSARAAEEEPSWPELHNKFILFMVFNLVAGMVETCDKTFLDEIFKFIVTPSVCGNVSFWNCNKPAHWKLLISCWLSFGLAVAHGGSTTLLWSQPGSFGWRCQDRAPWFPAGPPKDWASSAFTLPHLVLLKSQVCPGATGDS